MEDSMKKLLFLALILSTQPVIHAAEPATPVTQDAQKNQAEQKQATQKVALNFSRIYHERNHPSVMRFGCEGARKDERDEHAKNPNLVFIPHVISIDVMGHPSAEAYCNALASLKCWLHPQDAAHLLMEHLSRQCYTLNDKLAQAWSTCNLTDEERNHDIQIALDDFTESSYLNMLLPALPQALRIKVKCCIAQYCNATVIQEFGEQTIPRQVVNSVEAMSSEFKKHSNQMLDKITTIMNDYFAVQVQDKKEAEICEVTN
jgi:hypothetical protein